MKMEEIKNIKEKYDSFVEELIKRAMLDINCNYGEDDYRTRIAYN